MAAVREAVEQRGGHFGIAEHRDPFAEAEVMANVSAGLAVLRAVAWRLAKELDQDEIKQRLAQIAGRDLGAVSTAHEAGTGATCGRMKQVIG